MRGLPPVNIINKTMDLSEVKNKWEFDETNQVWLLEDVLYTEKAVVPAFQRLSIFVPKGYMSEPGVIDEATEVNGFTAKTVPIIFENNSAGYMQMPHTWIGGPRNYAKQYLEAGFVYITVGNRGHESMDDNGKFVGKAPANLVDLKTAIRFIRHNKANIPGNMDRIISVGWSAGGAMSTLLSVTGDNDNYTELLEENGAFMDESDSVYAGQIYCPIIDLEHADLAYEWMFAADKESENSPAGPAEVMDDFKEALSKKLSAAYIEYFNSLQLKNPDTGAVLSINEDGRSGSGYDYLMEKLSQSATKFLTKLAADELPQKYSVDDYLAGNYEYEAPAPIPGPGPKPDDKEQEGNLLQGFAGPGVALDGPKPEDKEEEVPGGLGVLMLRPPKGVNKPHFEPPMITLQGKKKTEWMSISDNVATIKDLDAYVLNHRRRMKPCTSFDVLAGDSGENKVFGDENRNAIHFNTTVAKSIQELKEEFPEKYDRYYEEYAEAIGDTALERREYLINPLNFINTDEKSNQAKYYRIRVGASDADTSLSVGMTLACKLAEAGYPVNYELVWDQPHSEADYEGEVIEWIKSII